MKIRRLIATAAVLLMCPVGCGTPSDRAAPAAGLAPSRATAATSPSSTKSWENRAKGVALEYPSSWRIVTNPDYELALIPIGASGDPPRITLDVPDLPPHLPFMLQMSRIERDYVADLKKSHPDLTSRSFDATLPDSVARLVRCVWHEDSRTVRDTALLIVHANAVYILDARTPDDPPQTTLSAFDSVRASLRWISPGK